MKRFFIFFCVLSFIASCAKNKEQTSEVLMPRDEDSHFSSEECMIIHKDSILNMAQVHAGTCTTIHVPERDKSASTDTIFACYEYIPLESTPDCMIGQVTKVVKCKDCVCVFDRDNSNAFLFNLDGSLRCKLGEMGHARQEYLGLYDVSYNARKEQISLLDLNGRKIMDYKLDGELQSIHPLYFLFTTMEYDNDLIVCKTGKSYNTFSSILDCHHLTVTDSTHKSIAHAFQYQEHIRDAFTYSPILKKCDDSVYFDDLISDTIWQVKDQQLIPIANFLYNGEHRFSQSEKENMTDQLYNHRNEHINYCYEWLILKNYIVLNFSYPYNGMNLVSLLLYSKKSQKYKICGQGLESSRLGDKTIYDFMEVWGDNSFISVAEPIEFINRAKDAKFAQKITDKEKDLISRLSADSNPILVITTILEF